MNLLKVGKCVQCTRHNFYASCSWAYFKSNLSLRVVFLFHSLMALTVGWLLLFFVKTELFENTVIAEQVTNKEKMVSPDLLKLISGRI